MPDSSNISELLIICSLCFCCFCCVIFPVLSLISNMYVASQSSDSDSDKSNKKTKKETKKDDGETDSTIVNKGDNSSSTIKIRREKKLDLVTPNSGRYIKLKQSQVGCVNLGEIQVFTKEGGPNIITPTTSVKMSSTRPADDFPSKNLVNNNLRDFAHTSCEDAAEITIDLGGTYNIYKIVLFNRPDCCFNRAVGIVLTILDKDNNIIYTADPIKDKNGNTTYKENNETTVDKINFYSAFIYTPPDKAPVGVYQMGVAGNNGSVSCDTYCAGTGGKSWNDELPISWKGAKCVGTLPVETGCANTFSEKNPTQCICEATFTKWN